MNRYLSLIHLTIFGILVGSAAGAIPYFEKLGYPCPPETNPADHLIDILNDSDAGDYALTDTERAEKQARVEALNAKKFEVPLDVNFGNTSPSPSLRELQPWLYQFFTLFKRNLYYHYRTWYIFALNIAVTVVIAVFVSFSVWRDIGTSKTSGAKRQPLLFFCVIHQGKLGLA